VVLAVAFAVAWHILVVDKDRVVDRDDTDIEGFDRVDTAKHAKHKDKMAVMVWADVMVSVVASMQAF
jgi:hypothetical protein